MMLAHWSHGLGDSGLSRELTPRRRGAVSENSVAVIPGRGSLLTLMMLSL